MSIVDRWAAWATAELLTNDYVLAARAGLNEYISDESIKSGLSWYQNVIGPLLAEAKFPQGWGCRFRCARVGRSGLRTRWGHNGQR